VKTRVFTVNVFTDVHNIVAHNIASSSPGSEREADVAVVRPREEELPTGEPRGDDSSDSADE